MLVFSVASILISFFLMIGIFFAIVDFPSKYTASGNEKTYKHHIISFVLLPAILIGFWSYIVNTSRMKILDNSEYKVHVVEGIPVYVNKEGELKIIGSHFTTQDTVNVRTEIGEGNFFVDGIGAERTIIEKVEK